MADMLIKLLAKLGDEWCDLVAVSEIRSQLLNQSTDLRVLLEHRLDSGVALDVAVVCIAGDELIFLEAKVRLTVLLPEGEEARGRVCGVWSTLRGGLS